MTMYVGTVASYAIELWSSASPNNPIGDATRRITLEVSVPSGAPGAPRFGVLLMFVPSGRDVPGPSKLAANPPDVVELTFYLYTPMDDYSDVLDLLRTVSVIGFNIDDDNASNLNNWTLIGDAVTMPDAEKATVSNAIPRLTNRLPLPPKAVTG
jgi:hypothetical protein